MAGAVQYPKGPQTWARREPSICSEGKYRKVHDTR